MEGDAENLAILLAENLNQYFEQLVLRYQNRLYAFVLTRVGEASTAEEIVQNALRQYPPERVRVLKLSAWLYEITRNTFYNERRDNQARAAHMAVELFDLSEESPLLLLVDQRRTPDEELSRRGERRELDAQIEPLPVHYQTAIRLYYFDNLSYREIADWLQLPVGTVKSHIHRGMQLLRLQMKEA